MVFESALLIARTRLFALRFNLKIANGAFVFSNSVVEKLYPDPERVGQAL
jgi:hypothetical protein